MIKNNFRILKKQYAYLQTILKTPVKFQKDWPKTVGGVADTRMVVGADGRTDGRTDGQTDRQTDGRTDTQNFGGYNIIPRHFLVAGHKNGQVLISYLLGAAYDMTNLHCYTNIKNVQYCSAIKIRHMIRTTTNYMYYI